MANTQKRKAESGIVRNKRSRLMIETMRLPTFAEREHDYSHFLQRLADQASEAEMLHLGSKAA
jgi:hypothetical protein